MARIKITKAAENNSVRVSNTSISADVPIDGQFHDIHDDLVPVLENSAVEFEVEPSEKRSSAKRKSAAAGGAAGLGGSAASPSKAKRASKSKRKSK